ncbi:MAG: HAD hydrolase-like protein [Lachnospiraceae bacterium]|nr:HAD hydrolase-like protein [Lachnospiraceae bacterium]
MEKNTMIQYAIWDLDGTLLDSLDMWLTLARRYLITLGIREQEIPDDLESAVDAMSLEESADYLKEQFSLSFSREEIVEQFMALVRRLYREELPFFTESVRTVRELYEKGCRMCILTTTEKECAEAALKREGIEHCFERIYTCTDLGMNKRGPEIYRETCRRMGFIQSETMIYEDADYALKAASQSGCRVTDVNTWH